MQVEGDDLATVEGSNVVERDVKSSVDAVEASGVSGDVGKDVFEDEKTTDNPHVEVVTK